MPIYRALVPVVLQLEVDTLLSPEDLIPALLDGLSTKGDPFLGAPVYSKAIASNTTIARTRGLIVTGRITIKSGDDAVEEQT